MDGIVGYECLSENSSLLAQAGAGAFAGIMEHTLMYPLDVIKTRMQISGAGAAAEYTGVYKALVNISSREGLFSLWRGLSSMIFGAGPAHALYFGTYEFTKNKLGGNVDKDHHPVISSISGVCATLASEAVMNPFDVIKQRMQLGGPMNQTLSKCIKNTIRNEGVGALYISYPTAIAMTIPMTMIQFTTYETISKMLNPTQKYDPLVHILSGGTAGALASAISTPLDVIKTMLQTRGVRQDAQSRSVKSITSAAKVLWQREGYMAFFKGIKPRIYTAAPSTAICWLSYEAGKEFLKA